MSLRVDLGGNGSGFASMLNEARLRGKEFARGLSEDLAKESNYSFNRLNRSILGMFVGTGAVESIKRMGEWFVDTGREIKDTSEQVGMSTDSWQKWTDAVDQAGLSTTGFMRVLETLRQKRTEALTDPKARGQLSKLGFSDSDISGDMDTDAFMKKALGAANGTPLQKKALYDILGSMGMKYAAVIKELPNAKSTFSPDDIQLGSDLVDELHDVQKNLVEPVAIGGTKLFLDRNFQKAFLLTTWRSIQAGLGRGTLWHKDASWQDGIWNVKNGLPEGYRETVLRWPNKPRLDGKLPDGSTPSKAEPDPMDAKLADQKEQIALHEQERQQRLLDSQRDLMTIGDRRASILSEMPGLAKQIAERTAKTTGEGFLTDSQKNDLLGVTGKARDFSVNELRQKFEDATDTLQLRYNKNRGDMRLKQLDFSVDSMSKVGLYSASAVAFNPLVNIGQQANQLLTQIVHNTTPKGNGQSPTQKDPHAP
jgi:hypothetical protein